MTGSVKDFNGQRAQVQPVSLAVKIYAAGELCVQGEQRGIHIAVVALVNIDRRLRKGRRQLRRGPAGIGAAELRVARRRGASPPGSMTAA